MLQPDERQMAGTVAVVTNLASPLGQTTARRLAAECAHLVVSAPAAWDGSTEQAAQGMLEELVRIRTLHGLDEAPVLVEADSGTSEGAHTIVHAALDRFGRVDAVVHNAVLELAESTGDGAALIDLAPLVPMVSWGAAGLSQHSEGNLVLTAFVRERWRGPLEHHTRAAVLAAFGPFVHAAARRVYEFGIVTNGLLVEAGFDAAGRALALTGVPSQHESARLYEAAGAVRFLASTEARGIVGQVLYLCSDGSPEEVPFLQHVPGAHEIETGYSRLFGSIERLRA